MSNWPAPFQPKLEPRATVDYRPAGAGAADRPPLCHHRRPGEDLPRLVWSISPQPHLEGVAEGKVSPMRITSPVAVLGELAIAAAEGGHLVRYKLPSLEAAGEADLPGEAVWGPFRVGEQRCPRHRRRATGRHLARRRNRLESAAGTWRTGRPAIGYRRTASCWHFARASSSAATWPTASRPAKRDVEHPLAAGPVRFMQRLVLAADDGTLLVVDQP